MAPFLFAKRMLAGDAISVFNGGEMVRDFTFIDDVSNGVVQVVCDQRESISNKIYNIGRGEPVELMSFIETLARHLKVEAKLNFLPMQAGDVVKTMADTQALKEDFGYQASVSIDDGVKRFARWYKHYYS